MKKILVTGGAGYIGSHTINYLLDKGITPSNIIVFDNLSHGFRDSLPEDVIFEKGDLTDKDDLTGVFNKYDIDSVLHLASFIDIGESNRDPGKFFKNNVFGGLNLLESMKDFGVKKIVFSSSCSIFGVPKKNPIDEFESKNPINPYGESKLMIENLLDWFDKIFGIKSVKLRYFNAAGAAYGIGERHDPETHLIPLTFQTIFGKRDCIEIFGSDYDTKDGTCIRDYIHVLDLAEAHYLALNYLDNGGNSEEFNLGSGKGFSVKEIINTAEKVSGKKVNVKIGKRRSGDPDILIANNSKITNKLGWTPKYDLEDIIGSAFNWHKNP